MLKTLETVFYTRVKPGIMRFGKKYEAWRKTAKASTCKEGPLGLG